MVTITNINNNSLFSLLKSKLREILNRIELEKNMAPETFFEVNALLIQFNGVWQKQEELRRERIAEEESLYVTK